MVGRKQVRGSGHVCIEAVKDGTRTAENGTKKTTVDEKDLFKSEVVSMGHVYPFRFIVPEDCTSSPCRWIYPVTFGGGLVGGDSVTADVCVSSNCACVVTSQESTKVYHCNHSGPTSQCITYTVENNAFLCVLPDPIVCFKGADFHQSQVIKLKPTSSLVFLDWTLSGRSALSESWSFKTYINSVEVYLQDTLALREVQELEDSPHKTVADGMRGFQVCGMCIAVGLHTQSLCDALTDKYGRKRDLGERLERDLVVSISPVSYTAQGQTITGVYLRFMASSAALAAQVVRDISTPLVPVLGADPYENKL